VVHHIARHMPPVVQAHSAERLLVQHLRPVTLTSTSALTGILVGRISGPRLTPSCTRALSEHGRLNGQSLSPAAKRWPIRYGRRSIRRSARPRLGANGGAHRIP
jgi:hypothetical protein